MSGANPAVPCADCKTTEGVRRKGSAEPKRVSGEKFGVSGYLCHRCYQRRYHAKYQRPSAQSYTTRRRPSKPIVAKPYLFDPTDEECQRLVYAIAKGFVRSGMRLEDLAADGQFGLVKACQEFDEARGVPFRQYAGFMIRRSIAQGVRANRSRIRVPRYLESSLRKGQDSPDSPGRKSCLNAARVVRSCEFLGDHTLAFPLAELVFTPEASTAGRDVAEVLSLLSEKEATVLRLRYGLGDGHAKTHKEIGSAIKAGYHAVRDIELQALSRARKLMGVAS